MTNPLKICDLMLRDGHQSLLATRMRTDDMLPIAGKIDQVGFWAVEMWGGATFDSAMRFLDENPWDRIRRLKAVMPNTPFLMLLRGQNVVGYKHYPDDVLERFVVRAHDNGIDVFRIFDALNDVRNLKTAMEATIKYGGWCEATVSYTTSPVHSPAYFVKLAQELEAMGAHSICIKDMANLLLPYDAYSLISEMKKVIKVPIHLHTHNTSGVGDMTYLKAIEAGVDIVDTALSPLANGTAQPCTESLIATLRGTEYDTGIDLGVLNEAAKHFNKVAQRLVTDNFLDSKVLGVDINTLLYQVPGGMLSNLISQLKQAGAEDKFMDVLKEIPRVREDFGYPPLVTPTSQIVGTQAVFNILAGERYKTVTKESKALLRGEYGQLPAPVNEDVRKKCIGDDKVITHRPADDIPPELDKYRKEIGEYMEQEEDILTYAMFPQVAPKFFEYRRAKKYKLDSEMLDRENKIHPV